MLSKRNPIQEATDMILLMTQENFKLALNGYCLNLHAEMYQTYQTSAGDKPSQTKLIKTKPNHVLVHVLQVYPLTYMSSLCSWIHILEGRAKDFFLTDGAAMYEDMTVVPQDNKPPYFLAVWNDEGWAHDRASPE